MLLHEIAMACRGEILCGGDMNITQISNDTRTIQPGALYVPIIGETFDGHRFIPQAFEKGAVASLTSHKEMIAGGALIYVADTLQALQDLAAYCAKKAGVPVVAVTGSVGKTSTRDMVGAVVASKYKTLKTEGNYNNNIGLPLTILRYQDEEAMVLEMGMNHAGEISLLTNIAHPDIALITNVGTAHIGYLGSRENILKAKLEIAEGLKANGVLIINHDNDMLQSHYEKYKNEHLPYRMKTFGIHTPSDVQAENVCLNETGSTFDYRGYHFAVPVPGEHFVLNALSAIAVGECLDISMEKMQKAIAGFELTKKRMDFIHLGDGIQIIDGSYNANLDSMLSSLAVLGRYHHRKIAVLADMLELGEYSDELHFKTGAAVDENKVDVLICVGNASKKIIEGAQKTNDKHWFASNALALAYLKSILQKDDIVLVKGSNSMRLKEIINGLEESFKNE